MSEFLCGVLVGALPALFFWVVKVATKKIQIWQARDKVVDLEAVVPSPPKDALPTILSNVQQTNATEKQTPVDHAQLHWKDGVLRRGLGSHLHQVNHIALVVEDIGNSLLFYSDIIGFEQIRRPNFDRHGAWLTMGNIELHLIKGKPACKRGDHDRDLIVSHIAIDCTDVDGILERLKNLKDTKFKELTWRQNVSVPDPETSRNEKFESHSNSKGKLTQFFLEDPDGYWVELCNCEILTKFCLEKEDVDLVKYSEGISSASGLLHTATKLRKWKNNAQDILSRPQYQDPSAEPVAREGVDREKLENLKKRRKTYGDICQGFSDDDLQDALANAGNDVPVAISLLKSLRTESVLVPPSFLKESDTLVECETITLPVTHQLDGARSPTFYV